MRPGRLARRMPVPLSVAAVVLALAGCADGQDPGVDPGGGAPATTSDTLGACPDGGPDTTTPPAGCLGPDGQVEKP